MIKSIHIKNFRSHIDFEMEFNKGLNVIIGENDAGKTTLIDSLKILFGNKKIDINDYNQLDLPVTIELLESDYFYFFQSKIVEGELENKYYQSLQKKRKRESETNYTLYKTKKSLSKDLC